MEPHKTAKETLSKDAIRWLANGDRGSSSNTMFTRLTGIEAYAGGGRTHPYDPSDFVLCELLLIEVPELRDRLRLMSDVSPIWAALVDRWYEIRALIDEEAPGSFQRKRWGSAPRAYELMREIIDAVPAEAISHGIRRAT